MQRLSCLPFIHFDVNLSPGLVLACCLILGVSVSSFIYRRQDEDPDQAVIFLFMIIVAIVLGYATGASLNLIVLGWVPWAVDAAMVISVCNVHLAGILLERQGVDEKPGLSEEADGECH